MTGSFRCSCVFVCLLLIFLTSFAFISLLRMISLSQSPLQSSNFRSMHKLSRLLSSKESFCVIMGCWGSRRSTNNMQPSLKITNYRITSQLYEWLDIYGNELGLLIFEGLRLWFCLDRFTPPSCDKTAQYSIAYHTIVRNDFIVVYSGDIVILLNYALLLFRLPNRHCL